MRPDPKDEGRRWLEQALRDLDDARFNSSGGRFNVACFLCQQAAEKAVKGFLVLREEEDVRGHSVAVLCDRAAGFDLTFDELRPSGASLDRHYIPTRYPNGLPGGLPADAFGADDADRAILQAASIIEAVQQAFDQP